MLGAHNLVLWFVIVLLAITCARRFHAAIHTPLIYLIPLHDGLPTAVLLPHPLPSLRHEQELNDEAEGSCFGPDTTSEASESAQGR